MSLRSRWMFIALEACLIPLAWIVGWALDCRPAGTLQLDFSATAWGVAATIPMLAGLRWALETAMPSIVRLRRLLDEQLVPMFRSWTLLELAVASVLAGVGEELLFRGVIQEVAARWLGTAGGLVLASALFGAVHCVTRTYAVVAGLIGLYLGGCWLATGNLLVPIVAHGLYDFAALVYLTRLHRGVIEPAEFSGNDN